MAAPQQGEMFISRRLLTAQEAATYIGFKSHWGIRTLTWNGELPVVHIGKRRIAFDVKDLDQFIEDRKRVENV